MSENRVIVGNFVVGPGPADDSVNVSGNMADLTFAHTYDGGMQLALRNSAGSPVLHVAINEAGELTVLFQKKAQTLR